MPARKVGAVTRRRGVDTALDELYAAPLSEFVARRKEIAGRLREQGRTDDAKAVEAVGKPKATERRAAFAMRSKPSCIARSPR